MCWQRAWIAAARVCPADRPGIPGVAGVAALAAQPIVAAVVVVVGTDPFDPARHAGSSQRGQRRTTA
jgi:hypothetical protein